MRDLQFDIDSIKCFLTTEKKYRKKAVKETSDANMKKYSESANNNLSIYKDFVVNFEKETLYAYSKLRGITIVMTDMLFKLSENIDEANKDWHYIFDLIKTADAEYKMENSEDVRPFDYIHLVEKFHNAIVEEKNMKSMILTKQEAKRQAKENCRFKYKIGEKYALRKKTLKGDEISDEAYQVRKVVYSIGPNIVNSVVMKQIAGKPCQRKTLNHFDCQTFHLKYEPDLFVFSMNSRFFKLADDWTAPVTEKKIAELVTEVINESKKQRNNAEFHLTKLRVNNKSDAEIAITNEYAEKKVEIDDEFNEVVRRYHCGLVSEDMYQLAHRDREMRLDILKNDIDYKYKQLYPYNPYYDNSDNYLFDRYL